MSGSGSHGYPLPKPKVKLGSKDTVKITKAANRPLLNTNVEVSFFTTDDDQYAGRPTYGRTQFETMPSYGTTFASHSTRFVQAEVTSSVQEDHSNTQEKDNGPGWILHLKELAAPILHFGQVPHSCGGFAVAGRTI